MNYRDLPKELQAPIQEVYGVIKKGDNPNIENILAILDLNVVCSGFSLEARQNRIIANEIRKYYNKEKDNGNS